MGPVVAVHQPNYVPWLGYFHKIAEADVFIFLDDVQFPKNSFTNRVQILGNGAKRWLTVPVTVSLGDSIDQVLPAQPDWASRHLDTLAGYYRSARCFRSVWPRLQDIYAGSPAESIAAINRYLVESIARELGLGCRFTVASKTAVGEARGDERLVELVASVAPGATYLSGAGGAQYQDPAKFAEASLGFRYSSFQHPTYEQDGDEFVPGLSIIDAVMRLGWKDAADLLRED